MGYHNRGASSTLEVLRKNAIGLWQGLFTYKATAPTRRIIDVMAAAFRLVGGWSFNPFEKYANVKLDHLPHMEAYTRNLWKHLGKVYTLHFCWCFFFSQSNHIYTAQHHIQITPSQTLKRRGISCGAKISSELEPSSILLEAFRTRGQHRFPWRTRICRFLYHVVAHLLKSQRNSQKNDDPFKRERYNWGDKEPP